MSQRSQQPGYKASFVTMPEVGLCVKQTCIKVPARYASSEAVTVSNTLRWSSSTAGGRARFHEGIVPSQQQKAPALPVWSTSAAETLAKGLVHSFDAMLQPQSFELNLKISGPALYSFNRYQCGCLIRRYCTFATHHDRRR